jgi:hypothetical protein
MRRVVLATDAVEATTDAVEASAGQARNELRRLL